MPYYAGIDGGQSATNAVIGDDSGRILGRGSAGPADEVDQDSASTRLRDALAAALHAASAQANLPPDVRFAGVVAGISGYEGNVFGQPPQLAADALALEHDAPIAHAGALGAGPGVVVIAGTGSVAYAVNESGASAMTGGWGYLFGDEGSAFWLARKALSQAMHDADAGEPNELAQLALQHFDAPSLRALSRAFYSGSISRAHLASFASLDRAICRRLERARRVLCERRRRCAGQDRDARDGSRGIASAEDCAGRRNVREPDDARPSLAANARAAAERAAGAAALRSGGRGAAARV